MEIKEIEKELEILWKGLSLAIKEFDELYEKYANR